MKKPLSLTLFSLILILSLILSCSKNINSPEPVDNSFDVLVPQAGNDNTSGGIYKGTIIGSSGSFILVLQKTVNKIYVTLDGVKDTLYYQGTFTNGKPVSKVIFNNPPGKTKISLSFSVDANGANPIINSIIIPNHLNPKALIVKETSNTQVIVFEGRYTKSVGSPNDQCTGTLNFFIINNSSFIAFYREDILNNQSAAGSFSGAVIANQINIKVGTSTVALTLNADRTKLTGTFNDVCSSSVNCIRTL